MARFSTRTGRSLEPNELALEVGRRRSLGAPLLDLTVSNPTAAGIEYPTDRIAAALALTAGAVYRPDARGLSRAREAVSADYARRGVDVGPNRILLTASTSESYAFLFKLLCDPGDTVLVPVPSYPLFEHLAALECVEAVPYPLVYHGSWRLDLEALASAVDARSRAVIVVNPNNPTGSFLRPEELQGLQLLAARHGLAIVADEVFACYDWSGARDQLPELCGDLPALTFCLGGLSKAAGLPQMKLGWLIARGPAPLVEAALSRLELVADTFLSVGTPVQEAAAALLEAGEEIRGRITERCRANLRALPGLMRGHPACEALPVEGGWSCVLRLPRTCGDEERVLGLVREDGVLVHPGYFFDFANEGYVVASLLTNPAAFREGIGRLLARSDSGF
ncbi:MAG: pyridoxal phosphate-dependent aminotransferase [Candidatus Wallbacteria bacterium]|nr:pyridoxal phosphate-dependent aminotransferase [Candidatus Wallbacteria bacterium]